MTWRLVGMSLVLGAALWAGDLDWGGVSVDLTRSGPAAPPNTPNLATNGDFARTDAATGLPAAWQTGVHAHREAPVGGDPFEAALGKAAVFSGADGEATITVPASFYPHTDPPPPLFSCYFSQLVELPPLTENAVFELRFRYRGQLATELPKCLVNATLVPLAGNRETAASSMQNLMPSGRWKNGLVELLAPKGTSRLRVMLRLYGCGKVAFDEVAVQLRPAERGVTVRGLPFSFVDNRYELAQGQPGMLYFGLRNQAGAPIGRPTLLVKLPAGVEALSGLPLTPATATSQADGGSLVTIDLAKMSRIIKGDAYTGYNSPCLLIGTAPGTPEGELTASYWYEDGAYRTEPLSFTIAVVKPVFGNRPAEFVTGTVFSHDSGIADPGAARRYAEAYAAMGFNAVHAHDTPFTRALAELKVMRYEQPYWLCNGYRLGQGPKPDNVRFQFTDGSYHTEGRNQGICPVEVYTRGPYFREQIEAPLRKMLVTERSADSIMPNWEPYMFDYRGCFCDRCKAEFQKYTGMPAAEVEAAWPRDIITRYRSQWLEFRGWQHGRLVTTLEETIAGLGREAGTDAHFVPEIAWDNLTERGWESEDRRQYSPRFYMENLPWLEPWGPYNFQPFLQPYQYNLGCHLSAYAAARAEQAFLARHTAADKRPKLIAFPHGYQGEDWITEPEAVAFETMCYFVNGWAGSLAYYFPRGYDARWWRALAGVNDAAAAYEAFTLHGERSEAFAAEPLTPLAEGPQFRGHQDSSRVLRVLPEIREMSLVQTAEWQLGKRRLFAIGNAWEHGDCFVRLTPKKLPWFSTWAVRDLQGNRCYLSPRGRQAWSNGDLRDGILVHVGALRFSFVVVEPYDATAGYGSPVGYDELQSAMAARLPAIREAVAADLATVSDQEEERRKEAGIPDYSGFKPMAAGKVSAALVEVPGAAAACVRLARPGEELLIDPAHGARVMSWKIGGEEQVNQDEESVLGLAVDAIWWPRGAAAMLTTPYALANQEPDTDGVSVSFSRVIGDESAGLKGVTLRKTFTAAGTKPGFTVRTRLTNTTPAEVKFAFRYHNMHAAMEINGGRRGWADLTGPDGAFRFDRDFIKRFYRMAATPDPELEGAFRMEQVLRVSSGEIGFGAPWLKRGSRVQLETKGLYGLCFWDSGRQAAATFEPIWERVTLAPGASWETGASWEPGQEP